jgi:hypothetical protein
MRLVPRNWRDFQHYKDRNPPWIRLHRGLLDNKDFQRLPVASRALAPMLWLLASESVDGVINADPDDLAFRLRSTEKEISVALRPLIDKRFFELVQDASTTLAPCLRSAVPETETEALQRAETDSETEAETSQVPAKPRAKRSTEPPVSSAAWKAYAEAYESRYGAVPVRNASVNGQMAQFVGRIPADEAPAVAAFYLTHQHGLYVSAMHPVNLLLRDCEKLRTEWATNRQITRSQAQMADRTQTNANAFGALIAEAKAREESGHHDQHQTA